MALVFMNRGEATALKNFLNIVAPQNTTLRLYKNDKVPAAADTVVAYTEADFVGYAAYAIDPADWAVTEGDPTVAEHPVIPFVSTGGGQDSYVYGYYATKNGSGDVVFAERFADGPFHIINAGDTVEVDPLQVTGQSAA